MNWNQAIFPSLKRRGGRAIKKMDPFRNSGSGLSRSRFAPVCGTSVASQHFIDAAVTPPFQGHQYTLRILWARKLPSSAEEGWTRHQKDIAELPYPERTGWCWSMLTSNLFTPSVTARLYSNQQNTRGRRPRLQYHPFVSNPARNPLPVQVFQQRDRKFPAHTGQVLEFTHTYFRILRLECFPVRNKLVQGGTVNQHILADFHERILLQHQLDKFFSGIAVEL